MTRLRILEHVDAAEQVFRDRRDAGSRLAEFIGRDGPGEAVVLALPRGGIPVADPVAAALAAPLHPVPVRKLPIPGNTEMGFGAVTADGTRVLNDELVERLMLSEAEIDDITAEVQREVQRRARVYGGAEPLPPLNGLSVFIVDDGLATGFTAIAAARMAAAAGPRRVSLCVPVSPERTLMAVEEHVDEVACLYAQRGSPFAVASFYRSFRDLSDEQVLDILAQRRSS